MFSSSKTASFASHVHFGKDSDSDESDTEQQTALYSQEQVSINPEDEEQISQFMSNDPSKRRTLADIIQEKLTEKRTEIQSQMSGKKFLKLR